MYTTSTATVPNPELKNPQQPLQSEEPFRSESFKEQGHDGNEEGIDEERHWTSAIRIGKRKNEWGESGSNDVGGWQENGDKRKECFEEAVRKVGETMQMEGGLELGSISGGMGGGRVTFLVYRVD